MVQGAAAAGSRRDWASVPFRQRWGQRSRRGHSLWQDDATATCKCPAEAVGASFPLNPYRSLPLFPLQPTSAPLTEGI